MWRVPEDTFHQPREPDRGVTSDQFYALVHQQVHYWRNDEAPRKAVMEEFAKLIAKGVFDLNEPRSKKALQQEARENEQYEKVRRSKETCSEGTKC